MQMLRFAQHDRVIFPQLHAAWRGIQLFSVRCWSKSRVRERGEDSILNCQVLHRIFAGRPDSVIAQSRTLGTGAWRSDTREAPSVCAQSASISDWAVGWLISCATQDIARTYTMAACCSVASWRGVDGVDGRATHSAKLLENKKRVAEMRTKTGSGSLIFFIKTLTSQ